MPTLRKTKAPAIDPAAIYVCWMGHASDRLPTCPRGTRLRADDARVLAQPQFFVPDGVPEVEWPSIFDGIVEEGEQRARDAEAAAAERPPVKMMRAVRGFTITLGSTGPLGPTVEGVIPPIGTALRLISAGDLLPADDPAVVRFGDAFEEVE